MRIKLQKNESKYWVTSDLHFFHKNVISFCPETRKKWTRTGDVHEMNENMILEWNETIGETDSVFILGDISFGNAKETSILLKRLNGKKILVAGNHDAKLIQHQCVIECFDSIHNYLEIDYSGQMFCMFHYPIREWNKFYRESIHLHGHMHGNFLRNYTDQNQKAFDCGIDAMGSIARDLDSFIQRSLTRKNAK